MEKEIRKYHVAIRYMERDYDTPDVVCFSLPVDKEDGWLDDVAVMLCNAIDDCIEISEDIADDFDSKEERMEVVFDQVAAKLGGTWGYALPLTKYIEV